MRRRLRDRYDHDSEAVRYHDVLADIQMRRDG